MNLIGIALVLVLLLLGARYLHQHSPKQLQRRRIKSLYIACGGDQDLVERLIFAETERAPDVDLGEAARRARERLIRDRR